VATTKLKKKTVESDSPNYNRGGVVRALVKPRTAVCFLAALKAKPMTILEMADFLGLTEKRVFPFLDALRDVCGVVIEPDDYMENSANQRAAHGAKFKYVDRGIFQSAAITAAKDTTPDPDAGMVRMATVIRAMSMLLKGKMLQSTLAKRLDRNILGLVRLVAAMREHADVGIERSLTEQGFEWSLLAKDCGLLDPQRIEQQAKLITALEKRSK
jgi:hypothetical protein